MSLTRPASLGRPLPVTVLKTSRQIACAALVSLVALGSGAYACSPTNGSVEDDGDSSGPGSGAGSSAGGNGQGGEVANGGSIGFGGSGPGGSGPGSGGACETITETADPKVQPADIIIAVDTSGSMDQEAAEVQANLNTFASIISNAMIDPHVILIAGNDVCIPAPLGSGNCGGADENLPTYRHVVQGVSSNNALELILQTYPQYQASLRPGASKTIAVVSDDESDLDANSFTSQLIALDPTFMGFKFDAIVAFEDPAVCTGCFFNCAACASACCDKATLCQPLSAAEGQVYKQLVQQTGGVIGDLCAQDFDPVFQDMATQVVTDAKVSCEFDIPMTSDPLDPNKVNVEYTPGGMGMGNPIGNVPGGLADCGANGGWYYDDNANPTKITLCPNTCMVVQADPDAKIDVLFGCETILARPE